MSSQSPTGPVAEEEMERAARTAPWPGREQSSVAESRPSSPSADTSTSDLVTKQHLPLQKRRRVTRACDECRRKKIKVSRAVVEAPPVELTGAQCDGKQPCTHCTVYSYDCTYDQPSNRRRNPVPQYIEALETRLQRAEVVLRAVLPGIDLDDPKYDAQEIDRILEAGRRKSPPQVSPASRPADEDGGIQSVVEQTGSLELDEQGRWDFHGHSSGYAFLRKLRNPFGDSLGDFKNPPHVPQHRSLTETLESPKSSQSLPHELGTSSTDDLPRREVAIALCRNSLDDCCALMRPLHRPSFFKKLHKIYDTDPERYDGHDVRFLPLLYLVMAVGCLFSRTEHENTTLDIKGYTEAIEQGYRYYHAGTQLVEITDCRDLATLQTVVFMIIFLQSTAKLSTCYAYLGIALRACCRLGLHRNLTATFTGIEREERRRLFWLVRKLETYVGALLGLPQMLSDEDIDQELPSEVPDEWILADCIRPAADGPFPLIKATNAHTRLTLILRKVVRYIYPIKGLEPQSRGEEKYSISHGRIREIERDLQTWMNELPRELHPSENASNELSRVQQLLRMSYAHVQMMLYRPFLHYVSKACLQDKADVKAKTSYACAAACVSVSRNIIHITTEMKKRGLLVGAYWFQMYTTYFAILSLVCFVLDNPDSLTGLDILKDAMEGRDTLAGLAQRSLAADRCTQSLASLFNTLPDKLKARRTSLPPPSGSRKRPPPAAEPGRLQQNKSSPSIDVVRGDKDGLPALRASTLPHDMFAPTAKRTSLPDPSSGRPSAYREEQRAKKSRPDLASHGNPPFTLASVISQPDFMTQYANSSLPDVNTLMFPSDNPFAYPSQPASVLYENRVMTPEQQQDLFSGQQRQGSMYSMPNVQIPSNLSYENLNMPMYDNNMSAPYTNTNFSCASSNPPEFEVLVMDEPSMMGDLQPQPNDYWSHLNKGGTRTGMTPGGVNLDELFGGEGWGNVWNEQGFVR